MGESDLLVRRVLDGIPIGIWVAAAPSGELAYANPAFREIMGTEAREDVAVGEYSAPYGICDRDGAPYPEERMPFVRALEARGPVSVDDIVIHRHDGGRVNIRAWATPLFDEAGAITHVAIAFSDITAEVEAQTARLESEERLHRTRRMESVGQLAGGIAHDFNNLLTAIGVVANAMARRAPDDLRGDVDRILEATDRAMDLTKSLLGFAGRGKNLAQPLALHQVIESLAQLLRRTLDPRIELRLELEADTGAVAGDQAQLEQVLMNLILNARDAIDGEGTIVVSTRDLSTGSDGDWGLDPGDYIVVAVDDTGPGIPEAIRSRVFEPYFTTKTSGPRRGSGLGLATVHGIAESHGGRVRLGQPGAAGARFEVALPASSRSAAVAGAVIPGRRSLSGDGAVLVVDDDPLVRQSTARALRTMGYTALVAGGGREALELFSERRDELVAILLDMVMPEMDGRATFAALRELDPSVRVILMTGYADNNEIQEVLDLGVGAFLAKPFTLDDLSEQLASLSRVA